ncbi:MAG: response regulator receiver protein [Desulfobulbaceae bacterium BRH_c16a]|nr:MAG: response regulator receiver protein [Desulfobulbaceae bacterium BRH_c16a]
MKNLSILVVDDDPVIRRLLEQRLKNEGFIVEVAEDGYAAERTLRQKYFDVVLTDLMMPGDIGGIEVLEIAKDLNSKTEVLLITAHSSVNTAVEAMKKGAIDYLEKPINFDELFLRLDKIANVQSILKNAQDLQLAMNTTESAASATIQDLEIQVSTQREILDRIETVLRDDQLTDDVKVEKALDVIDQV